MDFSHLTFTDQQEPISTEDLMFLTNGVFAPITDAEREEIISLQQNPWPTHHPEHATWTPIDPINWRFPSHPIPASYITLLQYADGGLAVNGEREIGFFGAHDIREYLLHYLFPEFMPLAVPFGLNGGGVFYVFDMRNPPSNEEFPILAASAGVLDFDDSPIVVHSLSELFAGTDNIEELL